MKLQLLKNIASKYAGPESDKLIDILFNKNNVNEFIIAKKLNTTINQTRNMLYKLADEGLVSFIRKKDKKKGGWYTYFWTLEEEKCLLKFKEVLELENAHIDQEISSRAKDRYYFCELCELEFTEEEALLQNFQCPECGEVMLLRESTSLVKAMSDQKERNNKTLEAINSELEEIGKKTERAKKRRLRAEEKKKEEIKAKRRAERAKARKKTAKKTKKKKTVKKKTPTKKKEVKKKPSKKKSSRKK